MKKTWGWKFLSLETGTRGSEGGVMLMLQVVCNNPQWEDAEEAAHVFRSISSMLLVVLNELESNTIEYSAVEGGVVLLADLKERQLTQLIQAH